MLVFVWLTSLSMIISRSTHVAAHDIISFFLWLMILKLKLQYFGHLMLRVDSLEKTLMLGGIGGRRRRGRQRMRWLDGITRWTWVWVNSGTWWWTGRPGVLRFTRSQRVRHDWATELNWTELNIPLDIYSTSSLSIPLSNGQWDCFHLFILLDSRLLVFTWEIRDFLWSLCNNLGNLRNPFSPTQECVSCQNHAWLLSFIENGQTN